MAKEPRSELQALYVIDKFLRYHRGAAGIDRADWEMANRAVRDLIGQVSHGIHVNPALLVYGNPAGETCFSKDVLAILYRHADDGQEYCHGFGNADIRLTSQGNAVTIHGLKRKTGVEMYAGRDGDTVVLRKPGTRLVEDF